MPFDFTNDNEFTPSYLPLGRAKALEDNDPESFRACLAFLHQEAKRSGYDFPAHLLDCAVDAMNVFVADARQEKRRA